jgi:hypothetical protein
MENHMEVPETINNRTTTMFINPITGYTTMGNEVCCCSPNINSIA